MTTTPLLVHQILSPCLRTLLQHVSPLTLWVSPLPDHAISRYLAVPSPILKDGSLVFSRQLPLHFSAPLYNKTPQKCCLDSLSPCPLLQLTLHFTLVGLSLPYTSLTAFLKVTNDLHVAIANSPIANSQSSSVAFDTFRSSLFLEKFLDP